MNPYKKGEFNTFFAFDCETSGMNKDFNNGDIAQGYQMVSIGLVLTDLKTLKVNDELYREIKWNGVSKWDKGAEKVHGLSKEYLEENGVSEEEALAEMGAFFYDNVGLGPIILLGQNVGVFDRPFLIDAFKKHGITDFKFAQRNIDLFSASMATIGAFTSDEIFEKTGLKARGTHNALEDAKYSLKAFRRINKSWQQLIERSKKG